MTRNIIARIIKDESGATAIEYGLIVALIAAVSVAGFGLLGDNLLLLLNGVAADLVP